MKLMIFGIKLMIFSNMYSHSSNDASDLETVQLIQNDFDINLDIRRMC